MTEQRATLQIGDPAPSIGNPFLDPARVRGDLYTDGERLNNRSGALMRAKTMGRAVPDVVCDLAREHLTWDAASGASSRPERILDVGCGRATSSLALTTAFPSAQIAMVDLSLDLLSTASDRFGSEERPAAAVQADFHRLPLPDGCCDLIVAAFCLYHSVTPSTVIREFARCLRGSHSRDNAVVVVTKSADSYRELDLLVASAGLDPHAAQRGSLYEIAHSGNIEALIGSVLSLRQVVHEQHTFRFDDLAHVAQYVATVPKYHLPADLNGQPERIAEALRRRLPDQPVTTSSTVTYVVASTPAINVDGHPGAAERTAS